MLGHVQSADEIFAAKLNDNDVNQSIENNDGDDYMYLKDGSVPDVLPRGIKFGHINMCSLIGKID